MVFLIRPQKYYKIVMNRIKKFHQEWLVLQPDQGSFTTESARWSNKDLDPVPQSRKKWEWYHVSGFWVASGFSASYLQTPSSAVALGLSPSLVIIACMIGNFIITIPCMSQGYIGSKVGLILNLHLLAEILIICLNAVFYQLSSSSKGVRFGHIAVEKEPQLMCCAGPSVFGDHMLL